MNSIKIAYFLAVMIFQKGVSQGAGILVDTFDLDSFSISLPQLSHDSTVNLPMANLRVVSISSGREGSVTPETRMTAMLDSSAGRLSFTATGKPLSTNPGRFLDLRVSYSSPSIQSIDGYSGFTVNVSSLLGTGALIVRLGSGASIYDESTPRLSISSPGEYFVPLNLLSIHSASSINQFRFMHFIFEAHTEDFAMTLDEITLVPEAESSMLILAAGLWGLRRNSGRRPVSAVSILE